MAKITEVKLVDDIDGTDGDETVEFGIDGWDYEIDLSGDNAKLIRHDLGKFIGSARRLGRTGRRAVAQPSAGRRKPSVDKEQNQAVREWARKRGMKVSDRGRIPGEVLDAYHTENGR